jgi:hypothetical protein
LGCARYDLVERALIWLRAPSAIGAAKFLSSALNQYSRMFAFGEHEFPPAAHMNDLIIVHAHRSRSPAPCAGTLAIGTSEFLSLALAQKFASYIHMN